MKTIRRFTILAGLSLVLFALGVIGARAQALTKANFTGTFTLPFSAQWGAMTFPAGEYTLRYGQPFEAGVYAVVITGKADGSPHGMILAGRRNDVSAKKNALVCIREGGTLIVRALELPAIGESVSFAPPHGLKLEANQRNPNAKTQVTEVHLPIERVRAK